VSTDAPEPSYDIVVPTVGRPELWALLEALDREARPRPTRIVVVDDRPGDSQPLGPDRVPAGLAPLVRVIRTGGGGPAAARNVGWRSASADWIVFLDDDVVPAAGWGEALTADLAATGAEAVQATIEVPLPGDRPPTDWERNVAGLATARWITADMAVRRHALEVVGGFDERFRRAYREDSDLALRLMAAGLTMESGARRSVHPVRPDRPLGSVRRQAGNADDVLMAVLHGRGWRITAGAGRGHRRRHLLTTALAGAALSAARTGTRRRAALLGAAWAALTAEFAWNRIRPGPRTTGEIADMAVTSVLIPPAAAWHWVVGWARAVAVMRRRPVTIRPEDAITGPVEAVLFDRDGTLIRDVPYNADPAAVVPMPGASLVLDQLRSRGVRVGVVSNQSGVGRGLLDMDDVAAVNRRVEDLLGPFDVMVVCPHAPDDGCECRKPLPGLVSRAAAELGVPPERCVMVGDIGSDVEAARRAGARHLLVPTPVTKPAEVRGATVVAADLRAALDRLSPYLLRAAA
jgi:HAD superfamily hydrolase (TIGR01662 family)